MLRVGLTGGIASGKSTISALFEKLGVSVIDTDSISRELMHIGQPAYLRVVEHFKTNILNSDKSINRSKLRQKVFNQPQQKRWLEQMIHPLILDRSEQAMQQLTGSGYALLVVPLMFETGFDKLVDFVIAIDCPAPVQRSRLMQRDGIDEQLAAKMIESQIDNDQRCGLSDYVIHNRDNQNRAKEVLLLHNELEQLASDGDY